MPQSARISRRHWGRFSGKFIYYFIPFNICMSRNTDEPNFVKIIDTNPYHIFFYLFNCIWWYRFQYSLTVLANYYLLSMISAYEVMAITSAWKMLGCLPIGIYSPVLWPVIPAPIPSAVFDPSILISCFICVWFHNLCSPKVLMNSA